MSRTRKNYPASFKYRAAMDTLREEVLLSELARIFHEKG